MTKNAVLNFALCCGAIRRHREKLQHRCTNSPSCIQLLRKIWENLLHVGRLVRTNLFIPSRFWTTHTNSHTCCQRYVATYWRKKNYRCTSTFMALNYCSVIFFKSLSYLHEGVRTNFSADFWTFRNFWPQFAKFVAQFGYKNEKCVVHLKGLPMPKKLETVSKSAYKRQRNACSN